MIDLFSRIKREMPPDRHDLTTAEGRAAWDAELRDFVNNIEDDSVRGHLGALVKEWRWQVLGRVGERLTDKVNRLEAELAHLRGDLGIFDDLADRIEELEGQLKATLDRETASQKRHDEKVDALEAKLAVAVEGFEELARLGNGDRHGNSFGNLIAQNYIAELKGGKDE